METMSELARNSSNAEPEDAIQEYTLADWLSAHGVTNEEITDALTHYLAGQSIDFEQVGNVDLPDKSPAYAWSISLNSLCEKFPFVAESINAFQNCIETNFQSNEQGIKQPYTLDRRPDLAPLVSLNYQGTPTDLISVAHEFYHAIQIQHANQRFIVPVLRELAAFIGELALLDYLTANKISFSEMTHSVWQQEDQRYLGSDVYTLQSTLKDENTPYNYRWNYPIARVLALRLYEKHSPRQLWQVFIGKISLGKCIEMAGLPPVDTMVHNYLPAVTDNDTDNPTLDAFRSLGIMTLLDLDYWQGQSEESIEDYFAYLLQHMQSKTAYIVLDKKSKPIGYATWHVEVENLNRITLMRQ